MRGLGGGRLPTRAAVLCHVERGQDARRPARKAAKGRRGGTARGAGLALTRSSLEYVERRVVICPTFSPRILAWEDGFCNFAATSAACGQEGAGAAAYADCEAAAPAQEVRQSLQPELFFKMSHDIYNYGEGLIGKVAADHSHKWVFKEPQEQQETSLISSWNNPADSQPRTWEAQFQSGIQTIALIAVREGVVQLGSMKKVAEDLSYVVTLRRKFGYLESIPGVLLPHPSSAGVFPDAAAWPGMMAPMPPDMYVDPYGAPVPIPGPAPMHIMPSMSSLEALLSKLPSVVPPQPPGSMSGVAAPTVAAKEEVTMEEDYGHCGNGMDMSSSMPSNAGESTSTSAAAAAATISSYFVDVGGKPSPSEAGF